MIKRPAQHTALTFLKFTKLSIAFLLLMVVLYPIMILLVIAAKVGIVLGIHYLIQSLTGSWAVLYIFAVLTFLFTVLSFTSRTSELGKYYTGLKHTRMSPASRLWYYIVFAIDFLVTDMLTLTASFILAYVYWMSAALQSFTPFHTYLQPFLALSILGGLLQILFSAYYLTHTRLRKVYMHAVGAAPRYPIFEPSRSMKPARLTTPQRRTTKKRAVKKKARKTTKRKTKRRTTKKKSRRTVRKPRRKTVKRRTTKRKPARKKSRKKSRRR